jgi:hypothetical protein
MRKSCICSLYKLKFVASNFFRLISDEPDLEAICREGLFVLLSEVVTTVGVYGCSAVYLKCGLTKLGTNLKGFVVLLEVGTSTTALFGVSTNRIVELWVEIALLRLVRGRTSRNDSSDTNFSQSTSTWSGHKLLALSRVCMTHCWREYDCQNHDLIVHFTN